MFNIEHIQNLKKSSSTEWYRISNYSKNKDKNIPN